MTEKLILKDILVENFRCHTKKNQTLDQSTVKIIGPNGCGKTSILEAIYLATQGKSFRSSDSEILKYDKNFYRVELEYCDGCKVIVFYQDGKKQFLVSSKKTARLPKEMRYPVVLFEPRDLHIIESSPTRRRTFFDRIFSQFNPEYSIYLSRYQKALQQRNKALKEDFLKPEAIFPWNMILAEYGSKIQQMRQDFIVDINNSINSSYKKIASRTDKIKIKYSETPLSEDKYLHRLEKELDKDKIVGFTTFGIHRDQFTILFNDAEAENSASRGEARSIMLALKFIESDLIFQKDGRFPIILLDDVFSELDEKHRSSLVKNFKDHQIILTSV